MTISYSGLTSYGKNSLPSVDNWGSSRNIVRDPPKSIMTRRIDKVGQTSLITEMIDESITRSDEAILRFARGINPSVSVSYSSEGNNGGTRSGSMKIGGTTEAYLPYRILNGGAFRPPVLTQFSLLPTSRMPRNITSLSSNPGFIDYSKNKICTDVKKEVKKTIFLTDIKPTVVYKFNPQSVEESDTKYKIQNVIKIDANSGVRTMDRSTLLVKTPTKMNTPMYLNIVPTKISNVSINGIVDFETKRYIQETNAHDASTNPGRPINGVQNIEFNTDRFIQETNAHDASTNPSRQINIVGDVEFNTERFIQDTNVHDASTNPQSTYGNSKLIDDNSKYDIKTKNNLQVTYTTQKTGNDKVEYIHNNLAKTKTTPSVTIEPQSVLIKKDLNPTDKTISRMISNKKKVSFIPEKKIERLQSDDYNPVYNLHNTLSYGSYSVNPGIPRFDK